MNRLSFEDSLKLLAPNDEKKLSPTADIKKKKKVKTEKVINSPIRINNIEEDFDNLYNEETMEISIKEEKYNIETPRTPTREKIDLDDISNVYEFLK